MPKKQSIWNKTERLLWKEYSKVKKYVKKKVLFNSVKNKTRKEKG